MGVVIDAGGAGQTASACCDFLSLELEATLGRQVANCQPSERPESRSVARPGLVRKKFGPNASKPLTGMGGASPGPSPRRSGSG